MKLVRQRYGFTNISVIHIQKIYASSVAFTKGCMFPTVQVRFPELIRRADKQVAIAEGKLHQKKGLYFACQIFLVLNKTNQSI